MAFIESLPPHWKALLYLHRSAQCMFAKDNLWTRVGLEHRFPWVALNLFSQPTEPSVKSVELMIKWDGFFLTHFILLQLLVAHLFTLQISHLFLCHWGRALSTDLQWSTHMGALHTLWCVWAPQLKQHHYIISARLTADSLHFRPRSPDNIINNSTVHAHNIHTNGVP